MSRTTIIGLVAVLSLGGCASPSASKYSHTPQTQVVVKGGKKKPSQANFRVSPEESTRTGAGGGASEK